MERSDILKKGIENTKREVLPPLVEMSYSQRRDVFGFFSRSLSSNIYGDFAEYSKTLSFFKERYGSYLVNKEDDPSYVVSPTMQDIYSRKYRLLVAIKEVYGDMIPPLPKYFW